MALLALGLKGVGSALSNNAVYPDLVIGLPEDDRPTFEWFGKSEPWAPPTRTSPRRQELKPNTYFGM